jgi:phage head maturation protease
MADIIRKVYTKADGTSKIESMKDGAANGLPIGMRQVTAIVSTASIDRDNEVVLPSGMRSKNYAGNPTVMYNHQWDKLPIGNCLWIKPDKDTIKAGYTVSDDGPGSMSNLVWNCLKDGRLNAHSISFQPYKSSPPTPQEVRANPKLADCRMIHRDYDLLEFSVVNLPAQPEALVLAISKGYSQEIISFLKENKTMEQKEIMEKVEPMITDKSKRDTLYKFAAKYIKSLSIKDLVEKASEIKANAPGVNHAKSLASAGKISHSPWDDSHVVRSSANSTSFLGVDRSQKPENQSYWKFPVILNSQVNRTAVGSAIAYAEKNGYTDIAEAGKAIATLCDKHEDIKDEPVDDGGM